MTGYHSSLHNRWIGIVKCVKRLLVLTNQPHSAGWIMGNIICCYRVTRISDHLVPRCIRENRSFIWMIDRQASIEQEGVTPLRMQYYIVQSIEQMWRWNECITFNGHLTCEVYSCQWMYSNLSSEFAQEIKTSKCSIYVYLENLISLYNAVFLTLTLNMTLNLLPRFCGRHDLIFSRVNE